MQCPRCKRVMHNLGNVSGLHLMSYPPQWDEVHACHGCRVRTTVRVRGSLPPDTSFLEDYEEVRAESVGDNPAAAEFEAARKRMREGPQ